MTTSRPDNNGRARSGSQLARLLGYGSMRSNSNSDDSQGLQDTSDRLSGSQRHRRESSPSTMSFSSSMNQKTPARSYFQHSLHDSHHVPVDIAGSASRGVREDTAELASLALSDIGSNHRDHSPSRHLLPSISSDSYLHDLSGQDDKIRRDPGSSPRPDVIKEVSEPSSPHGSQSSRHSRCQSALTELIKNSSLMDEDNHDTHDDETPVNAGIQTVTVREGIISQPGERTALLGKKTAYGAVKDIESQGTFNDVQASKRSSTLDDIRGRLSVIARVATSPKSWNRQDAWEYGIRLPASLVPSVILGLLLNVLDALSYGMILFPLGDPLFEDLGPEGISMFYVSCIVSQLVFSLGGSSFSGAIGSEMIEIVPFFHQMASTVINHVGRENENSKDIIRATVIAAYSISTLLTGLAFFTLGFCRLGSLIGFFPRHILIGCIGGVGYFLVTTGIEVSARLDGNLTYTAATLHKLIEPDTLPLWLIPLALAILLFAIKLRITHPLTDATYFLSIIAIFWFFIAAIPELKVPELREKGWVFEAPEAGVSWYHFYKLYSFEIMDWKALGATVPAMLALTFFALLHVPINIPALSMATQQDDLDLDRELRAHGMSNFLSGLCGSIQNYLVFANTVLVIRSGGDSRIAGVMLAAATLVVMIVGQNILGIIPIMVVGSLIFFLGFDLLREALKEPMGKVNRLEYLTIVIIVVTMGVWNFVYGILVGILLACVSYVLQTSQISAVRSTLTGAIANSTVRRHPIQRRFLEEAGKQIYVMKLAGILFFGTIVDVEKQIRAAVDGSFQMGTPIRYLILDLYSVDGVDFSASETFMKIKRVLDVRDVQLVISGVSLESKAGQSLRNVGLFDEDDGIRYFQTLNVALEFCENQLLKPFYQQQNSETESESCPAFLEVPKTEDRYSSLSPETSFNSPRRHHLHQTAINTLSEDAVSPSRGQDHAHPLKLILQAFSTVSNKSEDFWYRMTPFLTRKEYAAGTILYRSSESPYAFYLLEVGTLKAGYDLPQGKYSELIVAGTTCGELPFFSDTQRTSTTTADSDCVVWMLNRQSWQDMQSKQPDIAQELLKISLKLTAERMDAITKHMLLTSG